MLPWTHDARAGRPGYPRALIDEELQVEGLGAHLHRPGLSRRVPFTEMVSDLLLWSANDPADRSPLFHATPAEIVGSPERR